MGIDTLERPDVHSFGEVADQSNVQPQSTVIETSPIGNGYEYTREDGTVEQAATAEDAIRMCPVLGRLALQDPEAAKLLLEMNSLGQEKMAKERLPQEKQKEEIPKSERPPKEQDVQTGEQRGPQHSREQEQPDRDQIKPLSRIREQVQRPVILNSEPSITVEKLPTDEAAANHSPVITHPEEIHSSESARQIIASNDNVWRPRAVKITETAQDVQTIEITSDAIPPPRKLLVAIKPDKERAEIESHKITPGFESTASSSEDLLPILEVGAEAKSSGTVPTTIAEHSSKGNSKEDGFSPEDPDLIMKTNIPLTQPNAIIDNVSNTVEPEAILGEVNWANELAQEKGDIYDSFAEALHAFVETQGMPSASDRASSERTTANIPSDVLEEHEPIPAIIVTVSERLIDLEANDREPVAPLLADIVSISRKIISPESRDGMQVETESLEIVLAKLCVSLFEAIGIDYDEQSMIDFMNVMLDPDFQPTQTTSMELAEADLDHDGTREAKLHFSLLGGGKADVDTKLQQMLGKLVLFYYAGQRFQPTQ